MQHTGHLLPPVSTSEQAAHNPRLMHCSPAGHTSTVLYGAAVTYCDRMRLSTSGASLKKPANHCSSTPPYRCFH